MEKNPNGKYLMESGKCEDNFEELFKMKKTTHLTHIEKEIKIRSGIKDLDFKKYFSLSEISLKTVRLIFIEN